MFLGDDRAPNYTVADLVLPCTSSDEARMLAAVGSAVVAQAAMFDSLFFLLGSHAIVDIARRRDNALGELVQNTSFDMAAIEERQLPADIWFTHELDGEQRSGWEYSVLVLAKALNEDRYRQHDDPSAIIQLLHMPAEDSRQPIVMEREDWQLFAEAVYAHEWLNYCDQEAGAPHVNDPYLYNHGRARVQANLSQLARQYDRLLCSGELAARDLNLWSARERWMENIDYAASRVAEERAAHAS